MIVMENSDELEHLVKEDLPSFEVSPQDDDVVVSVIPRNVAGNPDSPQVTVFCTSIIDVIMG